VVAPIRFPSSAITKGHILPGSLGAIFHLGNLAQVDWLIAVRPHNQVCYIVGTTQEIARFHREGSVGLQQISRIHLGVIPLNLFGYRQKIDMTLGHFIFIEHHFHFAAPASQHRYIGYIGNFLDFGGYHFGQLRQGIIAAFVTPEGETQRRYIVDGAGFYQRHGNSLRQFIHVLHNLVVELHQRALHILSHIKLHRHHRLSLHGGGIDILDALYVRDHFLEWCRHGRLHLFRRCSGITDQNIGHRHVDLRFLLAGNQKGAVCAQQQEGDHQQDGEFRLQKQIGNSAR